MIPSFSRSRQSRIRGPVLGALLMLMGPFGVLFSCKAPEPMRAGTKNGKLVPCPETPNCVSTYESDKEHGMEPIPYHVADSSVKRVIKKVADQVERNDLLEDSSNYLHFAFHTPMGFIDDVEFLIDMDQDRIHFRSASRVGYSDMGKNKRRMKEFRKKFLAREE